VTSWRHPRAFNLVVTVETRGCASEPPGGSIRLAPGVWHGVLGGGDGRGLETERRDCDDTLRASEASRAQRGLRGGRAHRRGGDASSGVTATPSGPLPTSDDGAGGVGGHPIGVTSPLLKLAT
jgi:hypothetical protein